MKSTSNQPQKSIQDIWRNNDIPVIYRPPGSGGLMVRIPYDKTNMSWLRAERLRKPKWRPNYKCWEIPRSWFNDTTNRLLKRFGRLYIIQPYRKQEKCAPACWNAQGHECQCSCMGENHGQSRPGGNWFVVSEAFATHWHSQELACRLLEVKKS